MSTSKAISMARKEHKVIGLDSEMELLKLAIANDFPALLEGDTGMGKSYMIRALANSLGKTMVRMSLNGEVSTNELLGKWLAKDGSTHWQDGTLIDCMRYGHWFIADEINMAMPEVLACCNSILDDDKSIVLSERDGELVRPHKDFRFFATMNPPDDYAGTKELNKALVSRFVIVMQMSPYTPATELQIVQYQSGLDENTGRIMVDVANAIRKLRHSKTIGYVCSTRDLVSWARLFGVNGQSLEESFRYAVLNKASDEDKKYITDYIKSKALKVSIDWNTRGVTGFKHLTSKLALDIKKLEDKKKVLTGMCDDINSKLESLKERITTEDDELKDIDDSSEDKED